MATEELEPTTNSPADVGWNRTSTRQPERFPIPPGTPAKPCRSCRAPIFWTVTPCGRRMPVDGDGKSHFATCPHAAEHRSPR